jgi:hypothetical protein
MTHLANLSHSPRFLDISFNPRIRLYSSPAVNRQSPLRLLVLALLKIRDQFWRYQLVTLNGAVKLTLSQLSQVFPLEQIISLQEDLS